MKFIRTIGAALCFGFLLGAGEDFISPAARAAKLKYENALTKADAEYQLQCQTAKGKYVTELAGALKQAMKDEKLDEAVKIKAEVEAHADSRGRAREEQVLNRLQGLWRIVPTSDEQYFKFAGNSVEYFNSKWHDKGSVRIQNDGIILDFLQRKDPCLHRLSYAGNWWYCEMYFGQAPAISDRPSFVMRICRPDQLEQAGNTHK
jgi:hypothetical protein